MHGEGVGGSEQALQYLRKAWMGIKMKLLYLSLEHTELVYTDNVVIVLMSSWVRTPDFRIGSFPNDHQ